VAALTGPQEAVGEQVEVYRRRRDRLVAGLNAIPGVRCAVPAGAFYVFPDFSEALSRSRLTSKEFASHLLEEHGVAALDGAAFGARGEGRIRLSFASAQSDLDLAIKRIGEAVSLIGS
jgi:aspartate/methionine/tyrosine aminotransferase